MKNLLLTFSFLFAVVLSVQAQIKTPAPSPVSKVTQSVGMGEIEIEYSRPSMKGRTIFAEDGLVPFGQMWRTGANASTKVSFSEDVMVEGKELKAGKYALYTVPGADKWDIIFYKDLSFWGVPSEYKNEDEALRVSVAPKKMGMTVETFLINIGHMRNDKAQLELIWENTLVEVNIGFNTDKQVMASIEQVMAGPSARDYYIAARYYHDAGKDLNEALTMIQKANEMDPKFWQLRLEALILADLKNYDEAIGAAMKSKAMAMEEGNQDYVNMNEKSIKEWKAKLSKSGKGESKMKDSKVQKG
jgi:hypothetical protein